MFGQYSGSIIHRNTFVPGSYVICVSKLSMLLGLFIWSMQWMYAQIAPGQEFDGADLASMMRRAIVRHRLSSP